MSEKDNVPLLAEEEKIVIPASSVEFSNIAWSAAVEGEFDEPVKDVCIEAVGAEVLIPKKSETASKKIFSVLKVTLPPVVIYGIAPGVKPEIMRLDVLAIVVEKVVEVAFVLVLFTIVRFVIVEVALFTRIGTEVVGESQPVKSSHA